MYKLFLIFVVFSIVTCKNNSIPKVIIKTDFGNAEIELYPEKAPKTVSAFLSYVDSGFYKNCSFYRVIFLEATSSNYNSGIIQGGIWQTDISKANTISGIPHESPKQTGLTHTTGTISLARTTAGSANTEFFICLGDQSDYDSSKSLNSDGLGFAAFGKVTSGIEIIRKIHEQASNGEYFEKPIKIIDIERL